MLMMIIITGTLLLFALRLKVNPQNFKTTPSQSTNRTRSLCLKNKTSKTQNLLPRMFFNLSWHLKISFSFSFQCFCFSFLLAYVFLSLYLKMILFVFVCVAAFQNEKGKKKRENEKIKNQTDETVFQFHLFVMGNRMKAQGCVRRRERRKASPDAKSMALKH